MRRQLFFVGILLLSVVSLLATLILYTSHHDNVRPCNPPPSIPPVAPQHSCPQPAGLCRGSSYVEPRRPARPQEGAPQPAELCEGCKEIIDKVAEHHSHTWQKQEDNYQKLRSQLSSSCHGFDKAILTQANSAVGSKLVYDGEETILQVTPEIFSTFAKEHPFQNKTWDTCAVVGNGGILNNSSCGRMIDSAEFVIRCNLPPLANGFEEHVGVKTDLVTANPSILIDKYGSLMGRRRPFVESLCCYGNALLLLPPFSFSQNTAVSMRAVYAIEDLRSPMRPVFFNPQYLQKLKDFWTSRGLKEARLSTGLIMASLALELCSEVHLYGFWPFSNHPHRLHALMNHYYDNTQAKKGFHTIPAEFEYLLQLHGQGVLRLHLGDG